MNKSSEISSAGNSIHIIGLGVAENAELDTRAQEALISANIVIGSSRQLKAVLAFTNKLQQKIELPTLSQLKALINQFCGLKIAVLASGDPLYFGIGRWFYQNFSEQDLHCYAAISSIQAACHSLGIAQQDTDVVSLHGRPLASLKPRLKRNSQLIILTDNLSGPKHLARECIAANFADSRITVCENLGYSTEAVRRFSAAELAHCDVIFSDLNVCVAEVLGVGNVQPEFPGIPDYHFQTGDVAGKGMISKREVRLCILSFMQVGADDIVWDVGAGCGGVAVEMAYWQPRAQVYALECHAQRVQYLKENRERFGVVKNLHVIEGRAPAALSQLPMPSKVFIGGSGGELPLLLDFIWRNLPEHGVLVVSGVTERTKQELTCFAQQLKSEQVECVELSVKRGALEYEPSVRACLNYVQKLPVEIFKFVKTVNEL